MKFNMIGHIKLKTPPIIELKFVNNDYQIGLLVGPTL